MSSEIRPEDIEAAIAAAEQRRRLRQGETAQTAAGGPRRPVLERAAVTAALDREPPVAAVPAGDDLDDSWLDQPVRPRARVNRMADLPDTEVVWEPEPGRRGLLLPFAIAAVALLGFGGILWWAYGSGGAPGGTVPVIAADQTPVKVKPAEEGGLEVPDQDKLVYNQITDTPDKPKVEQLLPQPEQPQAVPPEVPAPPAPTNGGAEPAPLATTSGSVDTAAEAAASAGSATAAAGSDQTATTGSGTTPSAVAVAKISPPPAPAASPPAPAAPAPSAATAAPPATKQVAKATVAAPTRQTAVAGTWRIQLASVKSDTLARQEWVHMQKSHPDLLGDLRLTVQKADLGTKGVYYRIQAGPIPDRTTAEDVCAELKSAKQPCMVVKP